MRFLWEKVFDKTRIIDRKCKGNGIIKKGEGAFVKNIMTIEKMNRNEYFKRKTLGEAERCS